MTADLDIYRTASVLIREHGDEADLVAAQRADSFLEAGDMDGSVGSGHPFQPPQAPTEHDLDHPGRGLRPARSEKANGAGEALLPGVRAPRLKLTPNC